MTEFPAPPRVHVLHVPGAQACRDETVALLQREADVCLHLDPDRRGIMPTWLEALACAVEADADLDWSVVLQDDARPFRGWAQHLERACEHSPVPFLSLTHHGLYGRHALEAGAPYAVGEQLIFGGAVALHRSVLPSLLDWARPYWTEERWPHDDCLVAAYAWTVHGFRTACTARAIFAQPCPSLIRGHGGPNRFPKATIAEPGPDYATLPRYAPVTRRHDRDMMELVERRTKREHAG